MVYEKMLNEKTRNRKQSQVWDRFLNSGWAINFPWPK